jgi:GNAT superfamily N-acetyltransferase
MTFTLRLAGHSDGPSFIALVRAFADYEKLTGPDDAAAARLLEDAFGPRPRFELLVAEQASALVAYAAFFPTYSTFLARPSLYLEDLFVHPNARRQGIGRALLERLATLGVERGCGRFDWTVLDWNTPAQAFYASLGARIERTWWLCRLDGDALTRLGRPSDQGSE